MLTLATVAALGAAVVPAVGVIDSHSAAISQAPFSQDGSKAAPAHVADASIGSDWLSSDSR